jgi:hypothetical protein
MQSCASTSVKLVCSFVVQELVHVLLDLVFVVKCRNLLCKYIVLDKAKDIALP